MINKDYVVVLLDSPPPGTRGSMAVKRGTFSVSSSSVFDPPPFDLILRAEEELGGVVINIFEVSYNETTD